MKISRSLFLALTGAMAASSGCYVEEVPARPPVPGPPAPPPRPAYQYYTYSNYVRMNAPPPPRAEYPYAQRQLSPYIPIRRRNVRPVGFVTADPMYRPPPARIAAMSVPGPSVESGVAAPPPVTAESPPPVTSALPSPASEGCLDTASMSTPDCSGLHLDASCRNRSFVAQRCETYRTYMDAKIATVAIACMEQMSSRDLCDGTGAYDCGKQALSESCPDTELAQMCEIAAKSCHTTANDCTALLSGLNETGKQEIARCIGRGCQAGLYSCVEGLSAGGKR